jgi:hypothetical protein
MKRVSGVGLGALAFLALLVVGVAVAGPPGGTYKASDCAKYLGDGHRRAVIMALYLVAIAAVGARLILRSGNCFGSAVWVSIVRQGELVRIFRGSEPR